MEGRNCRHTSFRGEVKARFSAGVCFRPKANLHHLPTLPGSSKLKPVSRTIQLSDMNREKILPFLIGETLTSKRKMKFSGRA